MLLALALLTVGALPAGPDDESVRQAAALNQAALVAFRAERFEDAARTFDEAYTLDPHPTLLWNAGRAWQAAGDFDRARDRFEHFGAHPDIGDDDRAAAVQRVAALAALERERTEPPDPPTAKPSPPAPPASVPVAQAPPPPTSKPIPAATWALTAVAGAALVAAGTTWGIGAVEAASLRDAVVVQPVPQNGLSQRDHAARVSQVRTLEVAAGGLLIGALVSGVSAAVVALLQDDEPQ